MAPPANPGKLEKNARTRLCRIALVLAFLAAAAICESGSLARAVTRKPDPAGTAATVPSGTVLYLRLLTPVSTKTSKKGQPVSAVVAREVSVPGGLAIPVGATVKGTIGKCEQPSRPDQHAELQLNFTEVDVPGTANLKLDGHLSGVSNARETLLEDGTIEGVLVTEAPVTLLSGALKKLGAMDPAIAQEIEKQKIGQVDTSITYAAGTDLQFTLSGPLSVARLLPLSGPGPLPSGLSVSLAAFLGEAPQRSVSKDNQPGDPVNLVVIGTAQEIEQAFRKAGWSEPKAKNGQSIADTVRAVMNNDGFGAAPVSELYLYGRQQDLAFEKMLNTFNKRHHLRLWQSPVKASDGRPIWLGAATHDTGIDVHPGVVSHATDPDLDDERSQVQADLIGSGAVQAVELVTRPNPLTSGFTATGGAWHTDGRLLAVDLKAGAAAGQ
jgi:LssY C-terminus